MSNRGRHKKKKKNNLKELLKRISNNKTYNPFARFYKNNNLVSKQRIYLTSITDEEIIIKWLNTQKWVGYDKIIIDDLIFII